jgi:tyrosine-protein kinase Etk/Wzc
MERGPNPLDAEEVLDLRAGLQTVIARRKLALAVFAVIFVAGALFTFLQAPTYRASTLLLIMPDTEQSPFAEMMPFKSVVPVATEMEVLKTRTLAEQVVRALGLDVVVVQKPEGARVRVKKFSYTGLEESNTPFLLVFNSPAGYALYDAAGTKLAAGEIGADITAQGVTLRVEATGVGVGDKVELEALLFSDAVAALQEQLRVGEVGSGTNVVQVSADAPDPELARDIVNTLAEAYRNRNVEEKSLEASKMLSFIETQLDVLRGSLEEGESELRQFKSDRGIFMLSEQAEMMIGQLSKLEIAKAELQVHSQQIESLAASLKGDADAYDPYVIGQLSMADPQLVPLVSEFSNRVNELQTLRKDLTEDHPRVIALKTQIGETQGRIRAVVANAVKAARAKERALEGMIRKFEGQLKQLPHAEQQLAGLMRRSEVNAEIYTFLLKKHEESRLTQATVLGYVRVLDTALVPGKPVSPRKGLNLAIFLVLGALAGATVVLVVEYLDDSLKTPEEIEAKLGLNLFGTIPRVTLEDPDALPLVHLLDPRDPMVEAFKALRTNVEFAHGGTPFKTIVCISSVPSEGKTTVTFNLAATLAEGGARVLLIDVDFRRPQLHVLAGRPAQPGVTNFLYEKRRVSAETGQEIAPRLRLLAAGTPPPNPTEVVKSTDFRSFVADAREHFDYVIIDVPPSVAFTDGVLVATLADAVFLVVEAGRSKLPAARRALSSLEKVGAKLQGAIVNKVCLERSSGGYYYDAYYSERKEQTGWRAKLAGLLERS